MIPNGAHMLQVLNEEEKKREREKKKEKKLKHRGDMVVSQDQDIVSGTYPIVDSNCSEFKMVHVLLL